MHFNARARHRLAQRATLDLEVRRAGIAHQHHADLGRSVHAADVEAEGLFDKVRGIVIDGLAGERQLLERKAVVLRLAAVLHHAVVRGSCRHVGELVVRQGLEQTLRVESPAVGAHGEPQRQGRQRAMPQPVAPGG
ncbi:hypothetical protein SDC9_82663 [bioreactor metagenome]|uniref:Uncharacterized protein n=1 Tax=bioreactor metagenome TaxID=1076179 RepID=A0A644Z6Z9_9ZZZZ